MTSFTYLESKSKTCEQRKQNENRLADTEKKLGVARREGVREAGKQGKGLMRCKLPIIK